MNILLAWLWQGILVAGFTTVALRAAPRSSADTRHATWWIALAAVLGIPVVLVLTRNSGGAATVATASDAIPPAVLLPPVPQWVGPALAVAWVLIVIAGLMRLARRWHAARALVRSSVPFDAEREARLPSWLCTRATARRRAELRVSDDIRGACALGVRRPIIIVGRQLADVLDDAALDLIVLHEHAHLARRDDVLQVLQACVLAAVWWHPAVWWLSRRIDLDREAACDDYVLARTTAARQYASALLRAAIGHRHDALAIVPGAAARPSALRVRVAWLFDTRRRRGRPRPLSAIAISLPLFAVAGSPQLASLVVFVERAEVIMAASAASAPRAAMHASLGHEVVESLPVRAGAVDRADPEGASRRRTTARRDAAPEPVSTRTTGEPQVRPATLTRPQADAEPPLQSTRSHSLAVGMEAQPVIPEPSTLLNTQALQVPPRRAPWEALATSSTDAGRSTASAVADRAAKGGLSLGRAFSRTGKAFAGAF